MGGEEDRLKAAYQASDLNGDGSLDFDEFFALLQRGRKDFPELQAHALFRVADKDLDGFIDFQEFVAYLYDNAEIEKIVNPQEFRDLDEEEAKQQVLHKSISIRKLASEKNKTAGKQWREMTWRQRLMSIMDIECHGCNKDDSPGKSSKAAKVRPVNATPEEIVMSPAELPIPVMAVDEDSSMSVADWAGRDEGTAAVAEASQRTQSMQSAQPPRRKKEEEQLIKAAALEKATASSPLEDRSSSKDSQGKTSTPAKGNMFDGKTQEQMVNYAIHRFDFNFGGSDPEALAELENFKEYLKIAPGPSDLDVLRYVAKGTAGWVFLAQWKEGTPNAGQKVAMKVIRMTQALSGVKEWYISKRLRDVGLDSIVFTSPDVFVLHRGSGAFPVIEEKLKDAGPVQYYMCLLQDFMNGGDLEKLAEENALTPARLFKGMEDVALTLATMHDYGICHKDIKPENVLVDMQSGELKAAKLCDLGRAEIGSHATFQKGAADDIRRYGVTLFSLVTGEGWTKNRLIHEKHDDLIARITKAVESTPNKTMKRLPAVLQKIFTGHHSMHDVAKMMTELRQEAR
jgi:hypothetical protein